MLGTFRLCLALLVVNSHAGIAWWPGAYAVFSFYAVSGYLMTRIMNRRYGYTRRGFGAFWVNRFLRLYPPYWLACALYAGLIVALPGAFHGMAHGKLVLPRDASELFTNVVIFGLLQENNRSQLIPLGWALATELWHYLAISLGLGRSRTLAVVWLASSLAYLFALPLLGLDHFYYRYFWPVAGSLPFSLGCCLYHFEPELRRLWAGQSWRLLVAAAVTAYLATFALTSLSPWPWLGGRQGGLYVNLLAALPLIHLLCAAPAAERRSFGAWDTSLGDLSYPVYLLHWAAALLLGSALGLSRGWRLLALTIALTIAVSLVEVRLVSRNLDRVRDAVKARL